jgi:hypothetical protein
MTSLPILGVMEDFGQVPMLPATLDFIEEDASALAPAAPKRLLPPGVFDLQGVMETLRQEFAKSPKLARDLLAMLK